MSNRQLRPKSEIKRRQLNKDYSRSLLAHYMQLENQLHPIHYLVCLNLATNGTGKDELRPCQEVIQVSAILMDVATKEAKVISKFYAQVRPKCNPKISYQCSLQTGLKNEDIKKCEEITVVLAQLGKWLKGFQQVTLRNSTFLTWGSQVLRKKLVSELRVKKYQHPEFLNSFIDLQKIYARSVHNKQIGLREAAQKFKIDCEQQENSCRGKTNARILSELARLTLESQLWKPSRHHVQIILQMSNINTTKDLQYLLVLDFEATCEDNIKLKPCSEIIEFPIMVVDLRNQKILGKFHEYVTPTYNPKLTKFCTELTGITQEMVTNKLKLQQVLEKLEDWMAEQDYLYGNNFTFVTCGDWDLATCLRQQARAKHIEVAQYLKNYINIKKVYREKVPEYDGGLGMMGMLKGLAIPHQGRHHSGIDDVLNTCNICLGLAQKKGLKYTRNYISYVK